MFFPVDPIVNPSIANQTNWYGLANSVLIASKRHIVGTWGTQIIAWNVDTWEMDWFENQLPYGEIATQRVAGVLADGVTIIGTDDYSIFALRDNGSDYSLLWSVSVENATGVVLGQNQIFCNYYSYSDWEVKCASYSFSGEQIFDTTLGSYGQYSPGAGVYANGCYYFGNIEINCISSDGSVVFGAKNFASPDDYSATLIDQDSSGLYAKSWFEDKDYNMCARLYKLNFSGSVIWSYAWPTPTDSLGLSIYPDKIVVKASYDDTIRILNTNGVVIDTFTIPYPTMGTSSITGVNNAIYLAIPGRILGYSLVDFLELFNLENYYIDEGVEGTVFLHLSASEVVYGYEGLMQRGIILLSGAASGFPLDCPPPVIISPYPICCAKPLVVLIAPVPEGASWRLHFKIESFTDAEGMERIAVVDSSVDPQLFEYSTDDGLTWGSFPSDGLTKEAYGSLVRARCEVGPRQDVYLRASVGAEDVSPDGDMPQREGEKQIR